MHCYRQLIVSIGYARIVGSTILVQSRYLGGYQHYPWHFEIHEVDFRSVSPGKY